MGVTVCLSVRSLFCPQHPLCSGLSIGPPPTHPAVLLPQGGGEFQGEFQCHRLSSKPCDEGQAVQQQGFGFAEEVARLSGITHQEGEAEATTTSQGSQNEVP